MLLDEKAVTNVLTRMLSAGPLEALPKRRSDLNVLLALASARFKAKRAYFEVEVNERLIAWLDTFASRTSLDHVTMRRELVDQHFLVRNRAGSVYQLSTNKLDATIETSARSIDPAAVLIAAQLQREERKRAREEIS